MKITFDAFSPGSVAQAMLALDVYKARLKQLAQKLPRVLAEYGQSQAQVRFAEAPYDILVSGSWSTPDVKVYTRPIENGFAVVANGHDVFFVEFGAGIWYNGGDESYLGVRPLGISSIGQYGQGHGKQPMWVFTRGGEKEWTNGTPASNAMYFTAREIRSRITEEARKILNCEDW